MFTRESELLKNLKVVRRTGMVKFAAAVPFTGAGSDEEKEIESAPSAKKVLRKFKKSPDIPREYIREHEKKLTKGERPKNVVQDFFEGLQEVKKEGKLQIITAKLFRQHGIFKVAEKSVYQDLKTGDFWKISDDKKSVMRMFKEIDGVSDRASDRHSVLQKLALSSVEKTLDDVYKKEKKQIEKDKEWERKTQEMLKRDRKKHLALKDDEEATADELWKPSEKEETYFQKKEVERRRQKQQQPQGQLASKKKAYNIKDLRDVSASMVMLLEEKYGVDIMKTPEIKKQISSFVDTQVKPFLTKLVGKQVV
jgi:hypothetical protein